MKKTTLLKTMLLLCALVVGSNSLWAAVGDVLAELSNTAGTGYATRQTKTDSYSVGWVLSGSSSGVWGSNSSQKGNVKPTEADLPVVKGVTPSATTSTQYHYFYYTTTAVSNVGSVEFSFDNTYDTGTSCNVYIVMGDNKSASGGDAYTQVELSNSSATKQGASIKSEGTYTFTFASTQTSAKYYGLVIKVSNSSYKRFGSASLTLKEGSTGPTKVVSVTSLAFGEVEATGSKELTFTVTPSNLTAGLTLSTNNGLYTVSPTNISKDATGAQTITVTAYPTTVNDEMAGTITISGDDFEGDDSEVTLSTTVIRKAAGFSFSETSVTLTNSDEDREAFSVSFNNPNSLSGIVFKSSYEDVATVSPIGVIELGASTGTAVITATFDQNDVYATGEATCVITVNPAGVTPEPVPDAYYERVTEVTDGQYLIVNEVSSIAMSNAVDASNNNIDVSISEYKIDATAATIGAEFTITKSGSVYHIMGSNNKYIGRSQSSNGLDCTDDPQDNSITFSDSKAIIKTGSSTATLQVNGGTRFRFYTTSQSPVYLYKKVTAAPPASIKIYISEAGYATYASNFDLDFTDVDDLNAFIAKEVDDEVKLIPKNKIPSGTGILLHATDGGGKEYTVPTTTETTDDVSNNLFVRGTGAAVTTSGGGSFKNYILNVVNNKLGFYQANGKTVATNRAYLHTDVAAPAGAIELVFDDEETTGIANVSVKNTTSSEYFNLAGQRVAQPTKGLYIVNGKKVVIK